MFDAVAEPNPPRRQSRWICLAEWVLGGWARTIRATILVLVAMALTGVVMTVLAGVNGGAAVAGLVILLRLLRQRGGRTAFG